MFENRLKQKIMELGAIGADPCGGAGRIFGSRAAEEEKLAVESYFKECGMEAWMDPAGNVHGLYVPEGAGKGELWMGSHYDSVLEGGMFDGLLGIVSAAECVRRIRAEQKSLRWRLHVIATNGEEGNTLGGTFGSRALMGMIDTEEPCWEEKAAMYGYTKQDIRSAVADSSNARCWLELHVEQGKTLESERKQIGIVTGIVGLQRQLITVKGSSNHAGTTMMEYRDDALVHAAQLIVQVDEYARQAGNGLVATFSAIHVHPNVLAVISDQVQMVLECRSQNQKDMEMLWEMSQNEGKKIGNITFQEMVKKSPVACDHEIMDLTEKICREKGISFCRMPSGATHDGNAMATRMPIGMIFVPSRDGISHSREEWTDWEQVSIGAEVMYQVICGLS